MSKLKTKSGAKKRFKVTGTGKVMAAQAGKRHGMIKRTPKQIRQKRGTTALSAPDAKIVKRSYMPYNR
jgi:large subunit ribosomal protein L35